MVPGECCAVSRMSCNGLGFVPVFSVLLFSWKRGCNMLSIPSIPVDVIVFLVDDGRVFLLGGGVFLLGGGVFL